MPLGRRQQISTNLHEWIPRFSGSIRYFTRCCTVSCVSNDSGIGHQRIYCLCDSVVRSYQPLLHHLWPTHCYPPSVLVFLSNTEILYESATDCLGRGSCIFANTTLLESWFPSFDSQSLHLCGNRDFYLCSLYVDVCCLLLDFCDAPRAFQDRSGDDGIDK